MGELITTCHCQGTILAAVMELQAGKAEIANSAEHHRNEQPTGQLVNSTECIFNRTLTCVPC